MRLRRKATAGDTSGLLLNSVQFARLDVLTYLKQYTNQFSFTLASSLGFILIRLKVRLSECLLHAGKGKVISMHITKAHRGSGGKFPLILNLLSTWDDVRSSPRLDRFTSEEISPSFPLYKRLSGPQKGR
jgi:hypothetical protein